MASAKGKGGAVATQEKSSKQLAGYDYGADAGAGMDSKDKSYLSIPFLTVLQAMSPQCQGEDSKGRPGQLFNSVTGETYKGSTGVEFIPVEHTHAYVEWVPREKGGGGGAGFVAVHPIDADIVTKAKSRPQRKDERRVLLTEEGNELVETYYLYGLIVEGDEVITVAVVSFTSTKIKAFRNAMSRIAYFVPAKFGIPNKPPLFAHRLKITSATQKNNKGEFYVLDVVPAVDNDVFKSLLKPDNPIIPQARQLREMVASGAARASYETERAATGSGGEDGADGEEIPF